MTITSQRDGLIDAATTDDGRITYAPIQNDLLTIGGRVAWRGQYCDSDGRQTFEAVDAADWSAACDLMGEVNVHRQARFDAKRRAADEAGTARLDRLARAMAGTRGTYVDENTF